MKESFKKLINMLKEKAKILKEKLKAEKINKKRLIRIVCSVIVICLLLVGVILIINKVSNGNGFKNLDIKNFRFIKEKKMTCEEYKKNSKEYYFKNVVIYMSKDYLHMISSGDKRVFEKKETKQRAVFYIKDTKEDRKIAKAQLIKDLKDQYKNIEYIDTMRYNENEFDIFQRKGKKGKIVKYVLAITNKKSVLMTYTYKEDGQDTDIEYILQTMRF